MIYFPQRTLTDCLLACVECFLQKPREELAQDLIEWTTKEYKGITSDYLTYTSAINLIQNLGILPLIRFTGQHQDVRLGSLPMIFGYRYEKQTALHAVYWDGKQIHDPSSLKLSNYEDFMKISYVFHLHQDQNNQGSCLPMPTVYRWDKANIATGQNIPETIDDSNISYLKAITL